MAVFCAKLMRFSAFRTSWLSAALAAAKDRSLANSPLKLMPGWPTPLTAIASSLQSWLQSQISSSASSSSMLA